jgi:hypothetical protein
MFQLMLIHTYISELPEDSLVLKLLYEIAKVIELPLSQYNSGPHSMVIHYLTNYRRRRDITKRSIDAKLFPNDNLLTQKIKKFDNTDINDLCKELCALQGISIENILESTLYVFLDKSIAYINLDAKKKKRKRKAPPPPGYSIP